MGSQTVKIATYNVENLFDLERSGNEYVEYIPNTSWQWNKKNYKKKLQNLSQVIKGIDADVIALQEIESERALKDLKAQLSRDGLYYKYYAIAKAKNTTVKVALLSKLPITYAKEISVSSHRGYRNILEAKLNINSKPLYLFVNHWKAKSGAESRRIVSAKVLKKRVEELEGEEIVLLGDFNSHYEENKTFIRKRKLNDTNGKTGINDILKTSPSYQDEKDSYYNLWYETKESRRWSHKYKKNRHALDNILISKSLQDSKGIEYVKGSFDRYYKKYLLKRKAPYRWQRSRTKPPFHTGKGYSDHFAIFAEFKVN